MSGVEWIESDGSISDEIIQHVERYFGIEFPLDYKECVKLHNGGYPEPDIFNIDEDHDAIFSNLLSFTSKDANIVEVYDISSESLPKGIFPFAKDPFGNLICFDYRDDIKSPSIVFFDHELVEEQGVFLICSTFTELLNSLYSTD